MILTQAPQSIKQKLNIGQITKDAVYIDAERRFKQLEDETKKLHTESKKYSEAVNGMLNHQIEFSKAVEEIYKPISGRVSDPSSAIPEGNPEGIQACEQYRELVNELQATLKPELDMIETRIVAPADELLAVIKSIRKMSVKRDHKQLDLDRHASSLAKLQNKKERSVKDEQNMYKAENNVEIATQEYEYFNTMLKEELPKLFELEQQFIKPLFESLYYMQLNIFYTLYMRMEEMKIPYFDMGSDIETSFHNKRGDIQERAEAIPITHFRVGHAKSKLEMTKRKYGKDADPDAASSTAASTASGSLPPPYQAGATQAGAVPPTDQKYVYQPAQPQYGQPQDGQVQPQYGQPQQQYGQPQPQYGQPQPQYGQPQDGQVQAQPQYGQPQQQQYNYQSPASNAYTPPASQGYNYQYQQTPAAAPPTPVQAPAVAGEWCTALYDYAAQAQGDLSIRAGDRIEILQKTADSNGWWTGRVNGLVGVFPGNYVQLG